MNNKDWIKQNVFFACSKKDFEEEIAKRGWKPKEVVSLEGTLGFCHISNVSELIRRFGGVASENLKKR